jgi:2,5-diamino-6-hydroxy-4-(5-phosphoribosylamino)pyrimidine 1'-reductase
MYFNQLQEPKKGYPYVVMMSAPTIDGKLTVKRGMKGSLGPYAREELAYELFEVRANVKGIMVGGNTVVVDNPSLTVRGIEADNVPARIIVDPECIIPLDAKVLNDMEANTYIAVTEKSNQSRIKELNEKEKVEVLICGQGDHVDLDLLMRELYKKGIDVLLVEGGGTLNWYMLHNHLVHDIRVLYIPIIVGGLNNVSFVDGEGCQTTDDVIKLELEELKFLGDFPFLRFKPIYN